MAGIVGYQVPPIQYLGLSGQISEELNELVDPTPFLDWYDFVQLMVSGQYDEYRLSASNHWAVSGTAVKSFKDDYYERIHVLPTRVELGTVANTQTRQISLWNAYTTQSASLAAINILNGGGITINGDDPPLVMPPLRELLYELRVTPNGPPQINAQLQFDFSDVDYPLPVVIVGNRAVVMPTMPEVPVRETWSWLTDTHISVDGTEQRIGLRRVPRRQQTTKLVFSDEATLREQYRILLGASGRLFVPYWQYASTLSSPIVAGATSISFDTGACDVRDDEYVLIISGQLSLLVQLDAVGSTSATLKAPINIDVPKGAVVVAIYPSLLPNGVSLGRAAYDGYGTMNLRSDATYPKLTFQRPGSTATLTMLEGEVVLTQRPLVEDSVDHVFDTGQESDDAKTGLVQLSLNWDFTKVDQGVVFKVRRVGRQDCGGGTGVEAFDYWRLFFDTMKGSLGTFLMPTYRPDQVLFSPMGVGTSSAVFYGPTYAEDFYPIPAYRYLAFETAAGTHYAKVTGASKDVDGNTSVSFTPSVPTGEGWTDVSKVSYMTKLRLAEDKVELEHFQLDTFINFSVRTAKA